MSEETFNNHKQTISIPNCDVCYDKLNENEISLNTLSCSHLICNQCFLEYLKTKMNDYNTTTTIPCFHHKCQQTLNEEYITSRISEDKITFNKYKTFIYNNEIKHNPNKKFCPFPNCESYLLKENTNDFVQCQEGHKYCFNCVNEWHPNSQCDISDKHFKIIEGNYVIKKCPKCNYYIDKDKGCNHIVCYNCQYEWCWICLKEFKSHHYKKGPCIGLMFSSINFIEEKDKQLSQGTNPQEEPFVDMVNNDLPQINYNNTTCLTCLCYDKCCSKSLNEEFDDISFGYDLLIYSPFLSLCFVIIKLLKLYDDTECPNISLIIMAITYSLIGFITILPPLQLAIGLFCLIINVDYCIRNKISLGIM